MEKKRIILLLCVLAGVTLLAGACDFRKMPLPAAQTSVSSFGANDTSYVEIFPVWDSQSLGVDILHPTDIVEGPDGYLWLANAGKDEILCLKKSGELILQNGFDQISPIPHPTSITIDSKLNLIIANGTHVLYAWNEYFHIVGVKAVAFRGVFQRSNGDTVQYPIDKTLYLLENQIDTLNFKEYSFSTDPQDISKIKSVYKFYESPDPGLQYFGVAAGRFGSDEIYVSETQKHRIARFRLSPFAVVRTVEERILFAYKGKFERNVVTYGSGAGTVDTPRGIYVDKYGNLYISQLGGNFLVQKLKAESFVSQFELYKHPIMDLNRFREPFDITTDDQNDIFVVDRGWQRVFKFKNSSPGEGREVDLGRRGLATATFEDPRGILAVDGVVYVVDYQANQIRRFKISVSESDIPTEPGGEQP